MEKESFVIARALDYYALHMQEAADREAADGRIAAIALELQERRVLEDLADDLINHLQVAADRNEPVYQP